MMFATTSTPPAAAHSHLWYDCATVICLAVAALVVLFCIYWAVKIWERLRIIAHYRREEKLNCQAAKTANQRDAGPHQKGKS